MLHDRTGLRLDAATQNGAAGRHPGLPDSPGFPSIGVIAADAPWQPSKVFRILVTVLLAASFVALSIICLRRSPSVSYDASFGLLTLHSMAKGSAFNFLRTASPDDLSIDRDEFWAAHTPGQFFLPGLLRRFISMPIGLSLSILQVVGVGVGLVGYYLLYTRTFGFPAAVALVATVLVAFRRETLYQFLVYSGGPLLLFAGTPYFLMSSLACLRKRGFYLAFVPMIFLAGAYLKLSFALIALSVIAASALNAFLRRNEIGRRNVMLQSVVDIGLFVLFYLVLYFFHISRGWTAAHLAEGMPIGKAVFLFGYSFAAIVSGMASLFWSLAQLGSPLHVLSPHLYRSVPLVWTFAVAILAATCVALLCWVLSRWPKHDYQTILLSVVVVHVLVLTGLFLGGSLLAEDRHFWPVSAILLPGTIFAFTKISATRWRLAIALLFALQIGYALLAYEVSLRRSEHAGKSTSLDLSYPGGSQDLVDTIETLDRDPSAGRKVFFFTEPSLALLVQRNSILVATDPPAAFERSYANAEKVNSLVIVVPQSTVDSKTIATIQACFRGAKSWQTVSMSSFMIACAGCNVLKRPGASTHGGVRTPIPIGNGGHADSSF